MDGPKHAAKQAKKQAKADLKRQKKLSGSVGSAAPNPAERSAAAAERQVALQRFRVWLALVMALVAVTALLWSVKPWRSLDVVDRPVMQEPKQDAEDPSP